MNKHTERISLASVALVLMLIVASACQAAAETKIVFMARNVASGAFRDYINIGIERFEREHPGVKVEVVSSGDVETIFHDKLISMWMSDTAPDVVLIQGGFSLVYHRMGMLEPLDSYIARDPNKPDLNDLITRDHQVLGGVRIGFPVDASIYSILVNRDMFLEAGLPAPDTEYIKAEASGREADVWNWTTFADAAQRLSRDTNGDGIIDRWGFTSGVKAFWMLSLIWGAGGEFLYTKDGRQSLMDRPEALVALNYDLELVRRGAQPARGRVPSFNNSEVAMMQYWASTGGNLNTLNFDWTIMPTPAGPAGFHLNLSTNGYGVSSKSKHKQLAYELVKAITSRETQLEAVRAGLRPSVSRYSVFRSPEMQKALGSNNYDLIFRAAGKYTHPSYPYVEWPTMRSVFETHVGKALRGEVSPEAALVELHREVQNLLNK